MSATAIENPALKRMLKPAKPVTSGSRMAEAKAWRISLPRISESTISLVATVIGYDVTTTYLEAILTGWDRFSLALLTKGPDEVRGLIQLDDALRTGLIEAQTMGRVQNTPLSERPGTPIDAALCDHVVNAWLKGAAEAGDWVNDWETTRIMKDPRAAKVALEEGEYQATEIGISLGEGARLGTLRVLKPLSALGRSQSSGPSHGGKLAGFLALEAEIEAVLYHTKVPYDWLSSLEPGAILEIPRRAIDHVEVKTLEGKRITRARLGQLGGKRAVRILEEDAPDSEPPTGLGGLAGIGAAGGLPALPGAEPMGALPDLPDLPPLGGLPDLPEPEPLGALPDLPEPGGLPDIPGLPPLGDLD